MQQGMFGSQNLSPFLQDFINRRGATFGSNIQPVTTPPMSLVASGAEGLFKKLKPVYQDEPGQEDTGPPSNPTTADLIDGYNLLNNPFVSALTPTMFKPFTGIVSLMMENQIEDNLLGDPNKGGLTDPYGNPLTSIPRGKGLFGFEKDFKKAIANSLDPFGGGYSINEFEDYGGLSSENFNEAIADFQTQVAAANLERADPEMDEDDNTGSMGPGEEGPGQDALGGIT